MTTPLAVATESWPPNVAAATRRLHPRGVVVVADPDEPPLPFADEAFDLVTSRHPYRERLRDLHELIQRDGPFVAYSARHLIDARKR